jgi:hypothetical protein
MLDRERLSGGKKLMNDRAMLGLQPTALGRAEPLVGEMKRFDRFQSLLHPAQLVGQTGAQGRDSWCGALLRAHRIEGTGQ